MHAEPQVQYLAYTLLMRVQGLTCKFTRPVNSALGSINVAYIDTIGLH